MNAISKRDISAIINIYIYMEKEEKKEELTLFPLILSNYVIIYLYKYMCVYFIRNEMK